MTDMKSNSRNREEQLRRDLEAALTGDAGFSDALYREVLHGYVRDMKLSLIEDQDDALMCLVSDEGETAMFILDKTGNFYVNAPARDKLQEMWKHNYRNNLEKLIPVFIEALKSNQLAVAGIKFVENNRS